MQFFILCVLWVFFWRNLRFGGGGGVKSPQEIAGNDTAKHSCSAGPTIFV